MPYSKKHNTLFIHIPKTGGKSFEVAMGIASEKEVIKYKWRSFFNRASKFGLNLTRDHKSLERLWGVHDISLALQHLTYAEIELLNLLQENILKNSIKVTIVRNPFDRVVSSFKHSGSSYINFLDFIEKYYYGDNKNHGILSHKRPQIDFIRDKKGTIVVDNLIRFENIGEDFKFFTKQFKIKSNSLGHIGKSKNNVSYKTYYCEKSYEIVLKLFKEDINYFGYKF